jgi:hypothetical protein
VGSSKQIHVYSVFGDAPEPNYDRDSIIRVQFSGERHYVDPNLFDINFIPGDHDSEHVVIFPYGLYHMKYNDYTEQYVSQLTQSRQMTLDEIKRKKFCLFAVSNGGVPERNEFFEKLSQYKSVDSCGKYMNNLGFTCPQDHTGTEYFNFIGQYKFMICFENSYPHYLTEKLFNAYMNKTIPIYWGCPNVPDYINMSAILYLKPNFTATDVETLIQKVIQLDTNDELYQHYYNSTFFKDGRLPEDFSFTSIQKTVTDVLSPAKVQTR